MSPPKDFTIAICGAGLAGLGLALALHSHGIKCTLYEASATPEGVIKGSLQIAPNGQTPLDRYGIWDDLAKHARFYKEARIMKQDGTLIQRLSMGDREEFGYDSLRIIRRTLIKTLVKAVEDRGIEIIGNKKFVQVLSESEQGVTIQFADDTTATASLLIGADGIHSRIRQSLYPDSGTKYIGSVAVGGSVAASEIDGLPPDIYGIFLSPNGSSMVGGHTPGDTDYVAFVGKPYPDLGRQGWKKLYENKEKLREFITSNQDDWLPFVQSALQNLREEDLWLWPMSYLSELEQWTSKTGQILLIGDAAHAMPPTAGQGANMAFEDGYTLGLVLAAVNDKVTVSSALQFWQNMRKERIKRVLELSMQWAKMRDPPNTNGATSQHEVFKSAETHEGRIEQMRWVYGGVEVQEEQIKAWSSTFT